MPAIIPSKLAEIKKLSGSAASIAPLNSTTKPKMREVRAILSLMQQVEELAKEVISLLTDPLGSSVLKVAGDVTDSLVTLGASPEEAEEAVRYVLAIGTDAEFDPLFRAASNQLRDGKEKEKAA